MDTPIGMLLSRKGSAVHSVAVSASVADAVRVMNQHRIGSVVVLDHGHVAGMFTERDVLTRIVAAGRNPYVTPVHEVMTTDVITVAPNTTVAEVLERFTHRRCRHLPVLTQGGSLIGLISIGDISRWLMETHQAEAQQLRQYIAGGLPA